MATDMPESNHKLIGKNYTTPELLAKVRGKSKYAEDYRASGMLFCKLLLSPLPHARVKHIDTRAALAMPGVKAILTMDDLPPLADYTNDAGAVVVANKNAERALTMEPLYQGEPILAVAAVDELTAANAIAKIHVDFEPLPFVVDPLKSLQPGGPNARLQGNVWAPPAPAPAVPGRPAPVLPAEFRELKWTEADFAEAGEGRIPTGKATEDWAYGDLGAGFKNAALVLDETFMTPNISHQCLETRTAMAYWQNGKVYIHNGTQGTIQAVPLIARWLGIEPGNLVFISEYTGGGFGSKGTPGISVIIPALLSKKTGTPVMMRITREEEQYIGRARASLAGRMKVGFSKEGRILALDMFVVCDSGPYAETVGDAATAGRTVSLSFQPVAMRYRSVSVLTNTPPHGYQRGPGGTQGIILFEPVLAKATRKLGIDQVAIHRINAPEGKASFGPAAGGTRAHVTSVFVKEALDRGAEQFKWNERMARSGKQNGSKVRGVGVSLGCTTSGNIGFDGLFVIKPDGRLYIQSGIGNLGTESVFDVHRVVAEVLDVPWEKCEVAWGDTSKNLPWSCSSVGSMTIYTMTRAAHAVAMDGKKKLQQIAAKDFGGNPEDYEVAGERVFRKGGGPGMSLAQAAQRAIQLAGVYDGHELPKDINRLTVASARALAGQGLMGVARDNYPRDGAAYSHVVSFAEIEVDVETGQYHVLDFLAFADAGIVINPRAFGAQVLGGSLFGMGYTLGQKWIYDQDSGLPLGKRFHHTKPMGILDAPDRMQWAAVGIPDPETPVGARGIGEPPAAAGCAAVLNALSSALGDGVFLRAPVTADVILTSLDWAAAGRPNQHDLTSNI